MDRQATERLQNSRHMYFTCRSLVLEAFQQHPWWQVLCPAVDQDQSSNVDEQHAPSAEAAASHFVWAEYERLDWERIYAGVTPLIQGNGPVTTRLPHIYPSSTSTRLIAAACTACPLGL